MTKHEACSASLLRINRGTKNRLIVFRSYLPELNQSTGSWCSHACSCFSRVLYGFTVFFPFSSSSCAVAATSSHTLACSFKLSRTSLYDGNKGSFAGSVAECYQMCHHVFHQLVGIAICDITLCILMPRYIRSHAHTQRFVTCRPLKCVAVGWQSLIAEVTFEIERRSIRIVSQIFDDNEALVVQALKDRRRRLVTPPG